jgi:hypothetical protein
MFRSFLKWGGSSLTGHLVLSELAVAVPLFLLGLIVNIRSGYPTADLAWLIILPTLVGLLAGFSIWYNLTAPRIRRRGGRVDGSARPTDSITSRTCEGAPRAHASGQCDSERCDRGRQLPDTERRQLDDISRRPSRQEGLCGFSYFIPSARRALKKIVMVGEGCRTPL